MQAVLLRANLCTSSTSTSTRTSTSTSDSSSSIQQQPAQLTPSDIYKLAIAHFELWLLTGQMQLVQPETCVPVIVDACMMMLESVCCRGAQLAEAGHPMTAYLATCSAVRESLSRVALARAQSISQQFQLPSADSLSDELGSYSMPRGSLPAEVEPDAEEGGMQAARLRAAVNLGALPQLPPYSPIQCMLEWLQLLVPSQAGRHRNVAVVLGLHTVERELFGR